MASESKLREKNWLKTGCNAFEAKRPVSMPMSFWLEKDVWEYLRKYQVPYCKIYDMGYERTGCVFCMFGAHLDADVRFVDQLPLCAVIALQLRRRLRSIQPLKALRGILKCDALLNRVI